MRKSYCDRAERCGSVREFRDRITAAQHAELPGITGFATGLTLPFGSGPVEGNVNRSTMIKRQMYGRAGSDPLRERALLGA